MHAYKCVNYIKIKSSEKDKSCTASENAKCTRILRIYSEGF
jgi:hypothetical protein